MKIKQHKLEGIDYEPTRKVSRTRIRPQVIVMHYTAGWTFRGDVATLGTSDRQVSSHLVLGRREGELVQLAGFNKRCWHAGPSYHKASGLSDLNTHSVGIEITNHGYVEAIGNDEYRDWNGKVYSGVPPTDEAAPFELWEKHEHPVLGKSKSTRAVWEPYTDYQLDKLDEIVAALKHAYPSIQYVVSHEEIDTRGWKTDPGPLFPLSRYQKIVEGRNVTSEEEIASEIQVSSDPADARPYSAVIDIHIRRQPRWFGECNIIKTLEKGDVVFVSPQGFYWEFQLCFFEKDGEFMSGWVPSEYIKPKEYD